MAEGERTVDISTLPKEQIPEGLKDLHDDALTKVPKWLVEDTPSQAATPTAEASPTNTDEIPKWLQDASLEAQPVTEAPKTPTTDTGEIPGWLQKTEEPIMETKPVALFTPDPTAPENTLTDAQRNKKRNEMHVRTLIEEARQQEAQRAMNLQMANTEFWKKDPQFMEYVEKIRQEQKLPAGEIPTSTLSGLLSEYQTTDEYKARITPSEPAKQPEKPEDKRGVTFFGTGNAKDLDYTAPSQWFREKNWGGTSAQTKPASSDSRSDSPLHERSS
jgi:hypothetical protein